MADTEKLIQLLESMPTAAATQAFDTYDELHDAFLTLVDGGIVRKNLHKADIHSVMVRAKDAAASTHTLMTLLKGNIV